MQEYNAGRRASTPNGNGSHLDPLQTVINRLNAAGCDPRPNGPDAYESRCPAHKGTRRNLSIARGDDGRVLLSCHHVDDGGQRCSTQAIVQAIGLTMADLFPKAIDLPPPRKKQGKGFRTLDAAIALIAREKGPCVGRWAYPDGLYVCRFDNPALVPPKTYRPIYLALDGSFRLGDPPGKLPLYQRDDLGEPRVWLFEGERCVDLARSLGLKATTTAHGSGSPQKTDLAPLAGKEVIICPDHDAPGEGYVVALLPLLAKLNPPPSVKVLRLDVPDDGDDLVEWVEAREGRTSESLRAELEQLAAGIIAGDDGPGSGSPPEARDDPRKDRPEIRITPDEHVVIAQAVAVLARDPALFQRGNSLVTVLRDTAPVKGFHRPAGSPRIGMVPTPRVRELLASNARLMSWRKTEGDWVHSHAPDWLPTGLSARGVWPGVRHIEAVTESPILRPDGSILDRPGYDESTCLLYEPNAAFPAVPREPTPEQASESMERILKLVADFPFAGESHRAAWLAALLSPMARFAIDGPVPLFLFDANAPGSGKSLLSDVIAVINSGREMPRTDYPENNDELRKRITSVALAGDRMMMFDNVATTFGGSSLDGALTGTIWKDRILGKSELTADLPLFTCWYATGNNVMLRGDIVRRIVPCRLEATVERPEERDDFAIQEPLLAFARKNRPQLVVDCLTILRAYVVAGKPDRELSRFGSFESWSDLVRSAVDWLYSFDPCGGRKALVESDPESLARAALIEGFAELPGASGGLTAAEVIELVKSHPGSYSTLRAALMEKSRTGDLPTAQSLGKRLTAIKGRVVSGRALRSFRENNSQVWRLVTL